MYKCLPACVYLYHTVTVAKEERRGIRFPATGELGLELGYHKVVSHGGVLGTKPQSSARASTITASAPSSLKLRSTAEHNRHTSARGAEAGGPKVKAIQRRKMMPLINLEII